MNSISDQKALLRKELIAHRNSLSIIEWQKKSDLIKDSVLKSEEYIKADTIHCFISMNNRFEVNTHSLIEEMLLNGKKVVVPVMSTKNGILHHSKLESLLQLKENEWGVPEPKEVKEFDISSLELILVPLLGADLEGNRIGYGKGYYDRFLSKTDAIAIGILFHEFILDEIPINSFDRKLNGLISEKGLMYT